jgi:hypothetical protein
MNRTIYLAIPVILIGGLTSPGHADEEASRRQLKDWLADASSKGDVAPKLTATPFEYRTTNAKKRCEGIYKDSHALAEWWKCFKKAEDYVLTDFQNGGEVQPLSPPAPPPKSLAKLAKRITTPGTWAQGIFVGDGMNSHFLFLTTESGQIAALLVDFSFF